MDSTPKQDQEPVTESRIRAVTADDTSSLDQFSVILPENIQNAIITKAPEERFRLGTWSVIGLVVNRVIGTGIFNSPSTVMIGTGSVGISLILWLVGALYTVAGTYLYIEFGLTIPRYIFGGVEQGIPRNGGTLNYLQYAFGRPAYRPRTVLLVTCIFAVSYIIIGNMAGNCLIFGLRTLEAANVPVTNRNVRLIAAGAATFACGIHMFSRRGGIWLSNVLAAIKVLILLLIVITAICAWAGAFKTKTYAIDNMTANVAFADPSRDLYGYVKAFLAIIFAWTGFDQPNYVLGEIGRPRTTFPKGTKIGVAIVCILYMLVNVAYMVVVPKADQLDPNNNVALEFFRRTFGTIANGSAEPSRVLSAFMAISSFGNIVVMTFTAARVKQEIAKEGVLPWRKFFGSNKNFSFGRFLAWIQSSDNFASRNFAWLLQQPWMDPREHSQETPVGALFLHWTFTVVMILVTNHLSPTDAYNFLVNLYSYTIPAIFGFLVAIGMLKLRFSSRERWRTKSKEFNPFFSILAASVFAIASAYPIIASWVPPTGEFAADTLGVPWFTTTTVAWSILGFGLVWYLGFLAYAARRLRKRNEEFRVERVPEFDRDPPPDGPPVQVHETVYLTWIAKEANNMDMERYSHSSRESF